MVVVVMMTMVMVMMKVMMVVVVLMMVMMMVMAMMKMKINVDDEDDGDDDGDDDIDDYDDVFFFRASFLLVQVSLLRGADAPARRRRDLIPWARVAWYRRWAESVWFLLCFSSCLFLVRNWIAVDGFCCFCGGVLDFMFWIWSFYSVCF